MVHADSGELLLTEEEAPRQLLRALHKTIERVTTDMDRMSFNTAIAALIEFTSELVPLDTIPRAVAEPFVLLLSPLAPHMAEELWERLGHQTSLAHAPWPEADPALLEEDQMELVVQVNGKVRGSIRVAPDAAKDDILAAARKDENVQRHTEGLSMRREIYVPGRLVNLVVS